ncbi:MAG: hypothetical protein HUJ91_01880, partial [Bacteroidales bacterium]|nr:hypothetical protein [Bacteroidales bacterium]
KSVSRLDARSRLAPVNQEIRNGRNSALLQFSKALLETATNQYNSAMDCYNVAIDLDGSNPFFYLNRGALQAEMIDFIANMEGSVQVLTMDNTNTTRTVVQDRAVASYDYSAAIDDMLNAQKRAPDFPYVYYNLGNLYCLSGDLPASVAGYTRALELYPYIGEAYFNRGLVQIYLKEKEKGCLDISKAGELGIADAYSVIKKYCSEEEK